MADMSSTADCVSSVATMSNTWGTSAGAGWESTADTNWNSASNTAPEQPALTAMDTSAEPNGSGAAPTNISAAAATDATPAATPAERGANDEWTGHGQSKYDYDDFIVRGGEYDGNARVYHWNGEEGDVGPEFPELEHELFGPPDQRDEHTPADFMK